jgi:hypothetical protein
VLEQTVVVVGPDDLETVVGHGSVIEVTGASEDGAQRIRFAGDWRPMEAMLADVEFSGEAVVAVVSSWQILDRLPAVPA